MAEVEKEIGELVERIYALTEELYRLTGDKLDQALGPPATEAQIRRIEKEFDIELPEDYQAFLRQHNGWREFTGGTTLLSTEEMLAGELREEIDGWKTFQRDEGDERAAAGFVIEAALGPTKTFYDTTRRRAKGGMEVVYWRDEEIDRFPSFTAYLETTAGDLEKMVEREKRKLRKKR